MERPRSHIDLIIRPFQRFAALEAAGGLLLIFATVIALVWANSPASDAYFNLWQTPLTIGIGEASLTKALLLWINDGLMAIFFFVVGLEIKREVLVGELASRRRASLPIAAAVGGMAVPGAIYTIFNLGTPGAAGWGVPMATDIAFALGVLALLGRRAPLTLKVFLTAVAIVDDIGAVLVIAFFYTANIALNSLVLAGVFLLLLVIINWLGVRRPLVYGLLGIGLWFAFLQSGVHATIAGVLLALTIPSQTRLNLAEFVAHGRELLDHLDPKKESPHGPQSEAEHQGALQELESAITYVEAPLQRLEHALLPWVTFAIIPIFALANAGVALPANPLAALAQPVSLGMIAGLLIGKQVGVTLFAWLAVRSGIADLPPGITWRHIYGAAVLSGIGFTMSLFIANLAFGETPLLDTAKIGILAASLVAGIAGWTLLRATRAPQLEAEVAV